jgi:hyperosmotically inducible protein
MGSNQTAVRIVGALAVAVALSACTTTRSAGQQLDDGAITAKIESKLSLDPDINPFNVDVDTLDGVVTLRGEVEKASARTGAERLARDTDGVVEVRNEIRVQGEPGEDDETLSDAAITVKIKTKLTADPDINPFNVDVDTLDGVVTLSGIVGKAENVERVEEIARETEGVVEVRNELQVEDDG